MFRIGTRESILDNKGLSDPYCRTNNLNQNNSNNSSYKNNRKKITDDGRIIRSENKKRKDIIYIEYLVKVIESEIYGEGYYDEEQDLEDIKYHMKVNNFHIYEPRIRKFVFK